jgi:hypothetical protein
MSRQQIIESIILKIRKYSALNWLNDAQIFWNEWERVTSGGGSNWLKGNPPEDFIKEFRAWERLNGKSKRFENLSDDERKTEDVELLIFFNGKLHQYGQR